ncbi:MAG: AAA family ATPase [Melioribacteraceae bacterium]|nr:AAA family ATPase [Melioribacteraceae bacterium]
MDSQATRLIELFNLKKRNSATNSAKIVSIISGKGGTGKSFFSLNFAFQLAKRKKKILLIDFDYNFANLHLFLNKTVTSPLSDFFKDKKTLNEMIEEYTENLDIIFGDSGFDNNVQINEEKIERTFFNLEKLADDYDFIILDSAAGGSELTLRQISFSDYNIIITLPEPTSIMDAYVMLKYCAKNELKPINTVIVNKTDSKEEGKTAFNNLNSAVTHFLSIEVKLLGSISNSDIVTKSIKSQELLSKTAPESQVITEISEIAERFIKFGQLANNNQRLISNLS